MSKMLETLRKHGELAELIYRLQRNILTATTHDVLTLIEGYMQGTNNRGRKLNPVKKVCHSCGSEYYTFGPQPHRTYCLKPACTHPKSIERNSNNDN